MIRNFFFHFRGYVMAPYGVLLLILGKPSYESFFLGLLIACVGEAIRVWGVGYAGKSTRKSSLEAPRLVTAGPYAYIRHPLYVGNALTGLGGLAMAAGHASGMLFILFIAAFLVFYGTLYGMLIPFEEDFLRKQFETDYERYKNHVNRIFPKFEPYAYPVGEFQWEKAAVELNTLVPFFIVVILMALKIS